MLTVKLLGQFDVRRDGVPIVIPSRPAQSLLAFLLLAAGTVHRREKLAGTLWPNTIDENARSNLRHEIWRLRKALEVGSPRPRGANYLLTDELSVAFKANSNYSLDVSMLERAQLEDAATNDLIATLALYRGRTSPRLL